MLGAVLCRDGIGDVLTGSLRGFSGTMALDKVLLQVLYSPQQLAYDTPSVIFSNDRFC